MAANAHSPRDWSALTSFEEAHLKLRDFEDLESALRQQRGTLPINDHAGHQLLTDRLTVCRINIQVTKVQVKSANATLRRDCRN